MTDDFEVTPDIRQAWRDTVDNPDFTMADILANALRDCLAAKLKAEFRITHTEIHEPCRACERNEFGAIDPRHDYDWPAWQAAATKVLKGK